MSKEKSEEFFANPPLSFRFTGFGPAFWSNVHPISFASGEGGMEVIDGTTCVGHIESWSLVTLQAGFDVNGFQ